MSEDRLPIPRSHADELQMIAITAALRPYAESDTVRAVEITYWREGTDMPLGRTIYTSPMLHYWRRFAPAEATHLSIRHFG